MRALITGGAVRLGRAIALAFAREGFDLALHYNTSAGPALELAEQIRATGRAASVFQADLSRPEGPERLAAAASPGGIDVLIHSAAAYDAAPIEGIDAARWDAMMALNCRAPFLLTRALLGPLRASDLPGGASVILLTDIAAERPARGYTHYNVSKAAAAMLTRSLALELAPQIRVNGIAPGTVLPPTDLSPEALEGIRRTIPLQRFGSPSDIAEMAVFLTLKAPYVTGQIWAADGGRSVGGPMEAG